MKIYFIGQKGIPSKSGGVEKHVEDLAPHLVNYGHEVFVYTRFNYSSRKVKEYHGVKLINLPSIPTKHLDAITHTFFACWHLILFGKADVVHFHSIGPSFWIWLVKLLKPGTLVVATFHSRCYKHQKWGKFARYSLQLGERMCTKFADRLIVVSRGLQDYVKQRHKRDSYYIPNGVAAPSVLPPDSIRSQWGLETNSYILSVSRLVRHKGIHYLIRAFKELTSERKLVIVGEGAYTDDYVQELKQEAENDPRIIFTGLQHGHNLKELFSNAYLFVQPSEAEGLSIAILEAMSYGLPIVASDIPENQELLGDNNILFHNKDINDLKDKLDHCLHHPDDLTGKGDKNKEVVTEKYNWHKLAREVEKVYSGEQK